MYTHDSHELWYLVMRGCMSAIFHGRWLGLHWLVQQGLFAGSASANLCFFKLVEMRNDKEHRDGLCLVSLLDVCKNMPGKFHKKWVWFASTRACARLSPGYMMDTVSKTSFAVRGTLA